jgi:riboflavin kinase/FMN adenylyltransferase
MFLCWLQKGCLLILKIITNNLHQMESVPRGIGLGFFDGVHLGHRELIHTLVHECSRIGCCPTVYTFAEHPDAVLHRAEPYSDYITGLDERLALLAASGVAEVFLQHFDRQYASMEAEDFLDAVLGEALGTRLVVVGPDYRFGRGARGNVALLQAWADGKGITVHVVPEVMLFGQKVSSTAIRTAVSDGDLSLAASFLGRPFAIAGIVEHGRGLGKTLGFPTANIRLPEGSLCPPYGVYATRTTVDDRTYESITNIGVRPTVNDQDPCPKIETFLFNADLMLYDRVITVHFIRHLRPEIRFESLLEMSNRIHFDLEEARVWHHDAEEPYTVLVDQQIRLSLLRTRRFAQAGAQVVFRLPMESKRNARIALLVRVLLAGCRRLPDRKSLALALDELYGSSIDDHMDRQGDILFMTLSCDGLMHWRDGSSPFRDTLSLLFELLLDPIRDKSGRFDERIVEKERQNLIMEVRARENDRAQYAYDQGLAVLCGDQPHGLPTTGRIEDIISVTGDDLITAYRELLQESELCIDLGGDIDPETLELCITRMKQLPPGNRRLTLLPALWPTPFQPSSETIEKTEIREVEQARVLMLNSILGGDVHSLLFETVREKMGLAYSVFSASLRYLSSLLLMAGVRPDQTDAARAAMADQIARIRDDRYDTRVFDCARTMIEHSIRSRGDDLGTMLQHIALSRVTGRQLNVADSLSLLASVTQEQVAALASRLQIRACYILTSAPAKTSIAATDTTIAASDISS